jgi:hypothetical protein
MIDPPGGNDVPDEKRQVRVIEKMYGPVPVFVLGNKMFNKQKGDKSKETDKKQVTNVRPGYT